MSRLQHSQINLKVALSIWMTIRNLVNWALCAGEIGNENVVQFYCFLVVM